ncbi:MAG: hypothetical protein LBH24_07155 [Clostridiales bacterium]|jgi:hypothetical protein|nr:hypothetical protein [Clostridiales bacterium]
MYAETAAPDELAREDETPEPAALFDASRQAGAGREPAPEETRRAQEDAPLFPGGLAASGYIDNLLTDEGLKSYTAGRDTASPESGSYHFAPPEEYAQNLPPTPGGDLDITASIESFLTSDGESYRSRALREPPAEDEAAAALTPAYTAEKADEPFDESAYYVTPAKAAEKAQKPDYGFLSYHGEPGTTVPSRGGGGSHYIEKAYKSILESIAGDVLGADEQPLPAAEKPTAGTTLKEQIQTRNFGKLSDSIRDLGETAKIRTANTQSLKEYNRRYYYKSNKLMLAQFAIVFVLMLIESFAVFVLIRNGAGVTADHDIVFYVLSIVAAVALPVVGVSLYWGNPNKRKRYDFDFGVTMLYKLIVMLIAALLIYAFNVYLGMPMAVDREHLFSLIMPIVLTTNLPISTLIFNVLYKSGRFTVER